jgi:hypothetical protein
MLYPTHKKYGQVYGFLAIPAVASFGMIPYIQLGDNVGKMLGDIIVVILYMIVAYRGALFGAEFPDIDSPGSIPARKHYLLKQTFRAFRVKHRGKFSHDFASIGILFGGIYIVVDKMFGNIMQYVLEQGVGNSELMPLIALLSSEGLVLSLLKIYILFTWIGAYSHLIADASTKEGVWFLWRFKIHVIPVWITRIKIGGNQPFRQIFNTGTGWEMFNRKAMTYVFLPLSIFICLALIIKM